MAERRRGEGKKGNKSRNVDAAEERRRQAGGAGNAAATTREDMEEEEAAQTTQRHHGKRAKGRKQNKFNAEDPPSVEENEQSKKKKGRNQSGKQGKNSKGGKKGGRNAGGGKKGGGGGGASEYGFMEVSPARIRFAHSRIRPVFSGCGRRVEDTLADIREGRTRAEDLPLITVVTVNGEEKGKGKREEEPWFFSLNNRRLYVFKRLHEEGLLEKVRVRVRPMQEHERTRYTVERCSLQARIFGRPNQKGAAAGDSPHSDEEERKEEEEEEEEEAEGEEGEEGGEKAGDKEESSDAEST